LKRRLYLWSFYALSAFAVLTKGLIGMLIPGMIIGAWILLLGEWRLLKTLYIPSGLFLFLLIVAPWHLLVNRANPEFFNFYFIHEHFVRYLTKVHGRYQPFWFFVPIVLLGMFPWSAFLVQAISRSIPSSWRERHEHRDALFLLLWVCLVFLFFSASDSKLIPYILPIFPPLAILIGRYFAAAWDSQVFLGIRVGYIILLAVVVLLVAALIVLPWFWPKPEDIQSLGAWRIAFIVTIMIGAAAAWLLAAYRGFKVAFVALAVTTALFFMEANAAALRVDLNSVKKLAVTLKARLSPGDEVASYQTYYQDLPVYLERRITVVDWKGELEFGTEVEDTSQWMLDSATFWKRWQGQSSMYLVTKIETFNEIRKNSYLRLFPIAQDSHNILVSNKKASEVRP
jgi:4-amino-4-deoxy-L-arabinose transferase-like glycosyltransferase